MFYEKKVKCDGRTDGPTDGRTDERTDTPSYRDARTHLKTSRKKLGQQMRSGGLSAYLSLNQKFNSCVMD